MSIRKSVDSFLKQFENEYIPYNLITISRSALIHNIGVFRNLTKKQVIPVLKGNAYGHGIEIVAKALKDCDLPYIAVDSYFEALRIREVSRQPVLIMGSIPPKNFALMNYDNFSFVVSDETTIKTLGETGKPLKVHLECNTGMNRYGAQPGAVAHLARLIQGYKTLTLEGVMSHLADADGDSVETVDDAVKLFDSCVDTVLATGSKPTLFHIGQTAGSLRTISRYANVIRPGIGTYGINPFPKEHPLYTRLHSSLQPALRLTSTITAIVELKKGEKVGYNYTFKAPEEMRIGVIPIGYYEGFDRALSNKGLVKIGTAFTQVTGRICMNSSMVSLQSTNAAVGDTVILYSNNPKDANSINTLAHVHHLFTYELLVHLNRDVRRVLVDAF